LLLETRDGNEAEGTRVEFAAGKLVGVKPAGLPAGTTVSVADLFYCMPARRKFLKSDTTELGHIASLVTHYALANPAKQFTMTTPTQTIIDCPPSEKLADRVYQLFGRRALDELVEIPTISSAFRAASTEPEIEAGEAAATLTVTGFTSRPSVERLNRNGIYVFVNRRLVRDRLILHAIQEAYRNIMPPNVFPVTLLFVEMPYDEVDVNVHPAKIEVRFRRSHFVHDFTREAIRQALAGAFGFVSVARFEKQARNSRDRWKGLAAKSQRGNREQVIGGSQLTGRVAFECQQGVVVRHAVSIVDHADHPLAAHLGFDAHGLSTGVQGVLEQFLHDRCRTLHDFPRSDLVRHSLRQYADPAHWFLICIPS
jgi:DNA mismatch repair ATPase MutL